MFPTSVEYAPVVHLPWSGGPRQMVAPHTEWLFGRISPGGGDGRVEQRVFEEVASYGKQLGLVSELLLEVVDEDALPERSKRTLARLREITERIEAVKHQERRGRRERLRDTLCALRDEQPEEFERLLLEVDR